LYIILEEAFFKSNTSADVLDGGAAKMRCRNIATAIYLDDEQILKLFIRNGIS
jgi:hypothetical protein